LRSSVSQRISEWRWVTGNTWRVPAAKHIRPARVISDDCIRRTSLPSQQRLGLDEQQGTALLTMEVREQHEQASLVTRKAGRLTAREATMSCCRKSAFSVISSARERFRSAMKPLSTPEGRHASRSAPVARAARSATVAASRGRGGRRDPSGSEGDHQGLFGSDS
jgi:hypothetical protein